MEEQVRQTTKARKDKKRKSRAKDKINRAKRRAITQVEIETRNETPVTPRDIPRATRIQDMRGVEMRYWEEQIAQYRADKKGYTTKK